VGRIEELGVGVEKRAAAVVRGLDLPGHRPDHGHQLTGEVALEGPGGGVDGGRPLLQGPLQVGHDQLVLAAELPVEQVLAAAALVDQLLKTDGVHALLVEQPLRDLQDAVAGAR
jgi:hypothetical protein